MIDRVCNLWAQRTHGTICITTNGDLNARRHAVMGRGVARQAKQLFPRVARLLGRAIDTQGNHVALLVDEPTLRLVSFPVKHHWHETADLALISRSAGELVQLTDQQTWTKVYLPRPGCGNGGLEWPAVNAVLAPWLDDRFVIVSTAESR